MATMTCLRAYALPRLGASSSPVHLLSSSFRGMTLRHSPSPSLSLSVCSSPRRSVLVVSAGYKLKTHKASAKRFTVTGSGKIMRRRAGKQHLLRKKNTKRRVRLSKKVGVNPSDVSNITGALPYLKVAK